MPQAQFQTMEAPAAVAIGAAKAVEDLTDKTVQILGPFSANFDVEGSLDPGGTAWGVIDTITTPGQVVQIPGTYRLLRIRTTSFTSGTPQAFLGARNDRTR